ncbi:MAG: family 43 glycosylhydrolase [Acetatifactor sp.]
MAKYVLGYTRQPIDNVIYDPRLAYSLHLAFSSDGMLYRGLNHNSGVLFSLATENEDGALNPMSLKKPWIFMQKDGKAAVAAVRIQGDGDADESSKGSVLLWSSEDMLAYQELGTLKLSTDYVESVKCEYCRKTDRYVLSWREENGSCKLLESEDIFSLIPDATGLTVRDLTLEEYEQQCASGLRGNETLEGMEGAVLHNVVEIPEGMAERLCRKLVTPENTGVTFPESIEVKSRDEIKNYKATVMYSDGLSEERRVDWDLTGVDFETSGEYHISGKVHQDHFDFPVAFNRADPCIGYWKGKYYFISTNDTDHEHTFYVREADSIPGLVDAEDHLILDAYTYEGIGGLLWAPEFHEINGKLYIFHAATPGEFFWEESHIMELREGGNPICREDWSAPKRIVRKDGSQLCEAGKVITLDMTCFEWDGEWYAIWSQREFLPKDLGAWLYIAKLNPEKPWMLDSDPVVLSKPDYGWGNNHTFVEEGPFALPVKDKLYITFSAAAVDTSYVVGYLVAEHGTDLLDPKTWRKNNYPILTSRSVEGEYGTGHNAYVVDEEGVIWNTYHARPGIDGVRSSGVRRVYLDIDGAPMLDVTEEKELKEEYRNVKTLLRVVGRN